MMLGTTNIKNVHVRRLSLASLLLQQCTNTCMCAGYHCPISYYSSAQTRACAPAVTGQSPITAVHKPMHVRLQPLASLQCCPCTRRQPSLSRRDVEHVARGVKWLMRSWVWLVFLYFLEVTVSGSN